MTATGKPVYEETAEDADASFGSGRWETAGGCVQSLAFMLHTFSRLPAEISSLAKWSFDMSTRALHSTALVIHDYGCALGDGTALLQAAFPLAYVKGFDHSPVGVDIAKRRWRTIDFAVGDIEDPKEDATVIWTSHTLEHLRDPAATARALLQRCYFLVAVVPDIREAEESKGGHNDAVPTATWLKEMPKPMAFHEYTLPRQMPKGAAAPAVLESNVLCIWRGSL